MKKLLQNIFSVIKIGDTSKIITIFGMKIKINNQDPVNLDNVNFKKILYKDLVVKKLFETLCGKSLSLYFDRHSEKGTEMNFYDILKQVSDRDALFRVKYFSENEQFQITIYCKNNIYDINEITFSELSQFINEFRFTKIVLNNIAGYPNIKSILDLISDIKKENSYTHIIVKGHNFYPICPVGTLLNYNNESCNVETTDCDCKKCFEKLQSKDNGIQKDFSISDWRKMWADFLGKTIGIIEVFSPSSKEIFSKAFPQIKGRVILNQQK